MERRQSERVDAGVPVELDTASEKGQLGIAHEVSTTGLMLFSRIEHAAGDTITLRFRPKGPKGDIEEVHAEVIRSEPNDPESIWPVKSAVRFTEPIEVALDAISE